ncbi:hypothetical protein SAGO17_0029 [Mimivirus AB-566-O17]|uniref:Uncharacterized protein n=1 Tax=Mimivirus AB-566-O17 TaxID=1988039 RepID=A0A1X9VNQ9_9VIRU|nr:hypothetical protein SAGO17_0029 [Mimivirus AB-566-O17]
MRFKDRLVFFWNLTMEYIYTLFKPIVRIEEQVTLHKSSDYSIIGVTKNNETIKIIRRVSTDPDVLCIYDNDHKQDLTLKFKQFIHYYNPNTHTFQHLDIIKHYYNTSSNITLIYEDLTEHKLH